MRRLIKWFLQYIFFCQWMEIKKTANEKGIQIMGDVPFYVGVDSVDVWAGKDNFLLDTDGKTDFHCRCAAGLFQCDRAEMGKSDL